MFLVGCIRVGDDIIPHLDAASFKNILDKLPVEMYCTELMDFVCWKKGIGLTGRCINSLSLPVIMTVFISNSCIVSFFFRILQSILIKRIRYK